MWPFENVEREIVYKFGEGRKKGNVILEQYGADELYYPGDTPEESKNDTCTARCFYENDDLYEIYKKMPKIDKEYLKETMKQGIDCDIPLKPETLKGDYRKLYQMIDDKNHQKFPVKYMDDIIGGSEVDYDNETCDGPGVWRRCAYIAKGTFEDDEKERLIGSFMSEFLNFDVDAFIQGDYRLEQKTEMNLPENDYVGWRKLDNHNLSKPWNRLRIVSELGIMHTPKRIYNHICIPTFIKMVPDLLINFATWEYNLEGIEKIKSLQREYEELCYWGFIDRESGLDTNEQRYFAYKKIPFSTTKEVRDTRKLMERKMEELETYIRANIHKKELEGQVLDYILRRELYAMLFDKTTAFCQCQSCGNYFVNKKGDSKYCNVEYELEEYTDKKARLIHTYTIKPCDNRKQANKKYNAKIFSNIIAKISWERQSKLNRDIYWLTLWCNDNVPNTDRKVKDALNDAILHYQNQYMELLGDDENENLRIANEYELLLIQAQKDALIRLKDKKSHSMWDEVCKTGRRKILNFERLA